MQLFVGEGLGLLLDTVGVGFGAEVVPDGAGAVLVPEPDVGDGFAVGAVERLGALLDALVELCEAGLARRGPLLVLSTAVGAPGLAGGM